MSTLRRWLFVVVSVVLFAACAAAPPPAPPPCPTDTSPKGDFSNDLSLASGDAAASELLPVGRDDPQRGNATALVTVVEFGDFQCPFCARAAATMERVLESYGPDKVRLVWKHQPLSFHAAARPAAELSAAVMKLDGNDGFWRFHRAAMAEGGKLDEQKLGELTRATGRDSRTLGSTIAEFGRAKVETDMQLAERVGAQGTPTFFINGVLLSGAQPYEKFAELIDAELTAASAILERGVPRDRIYATRVAANADAGKMGRRGADDDDDRPPPPDDRTVWAVPIDGSPVQGPADALVTLVMFTDFQCPFCAKADTTVQEVRRKYGTKLRVVHKHNPLPFHPEAEPASELTLEILAKKGNDAFWTSHQALFTQQKSLGSDTYASIAAQLGLSKDAALAAIKAKKHAKRIAQDQALAEELEAAGTPTFFINGRRLVGAQPAEKFTALIDEELAKAESLVKGGTPAAKVYEQIIAIGKKPGLDLEIVEVPPPGKNTPTRGPANAPVVIQVWSDFQCPFCKRLPPVLDEVEKAFPGKVKIAFRHLPLPMHPHAALAAEAGAEAFRQGGSAAFWRMHDAMFDDQKSLDRQGLEAKARQIGLDAKRFAAALEAHTNRSIVEGDAKIASDKGISATPTCVVGNYQLSGAQPLAKFRRVVQRVLDEKSGARPAAIIAR